jgi:hypothetical protein
LSLVSGNDDRAEHRHSTHTEPPAYPRSPPALPVYPTIESRFRGDIETLSNPPVTHLLRFSPSSPPSRHFSFSLSCLPHMTIFSSAFRIPKPWHPNRMAPNPSGQFLCVSAWGCGQGRSRTRSFSHDSPKSYGNLLPDTENHRFEY